MSDIKISETAINAAVQGINLIGTRSGKILLPTGTTQGVAQIIQLAINEACKPLVEALEEVRLHHEDRFSNTTKEQVDKALADYRKEYGP